MNKTSTLPLLLALWPLACRGGITLAPHLTREAELGPAAAAGRFGVVMDRAATFEAQNPTSRDVGWYKTWRAAAMIGMGQVDQAEPLLEQVLSDMAASPTAPAQADRLRFFVHDLRARIALSRGQPEKAVVDLERAFSLAQEVPPETRGDCDQPLMLAARARQLADVASQANDAARGEKAKSALSRHLERWGKCLAEKDYPGLSVVEAVAQAMASFEAQRPALLIPGQGQPSAAPATPAPPPRVAPEAPKPAAEPARAQPVPAASGGLLSLPLLQAQYAPVDPTPWRSALDAVTPLAAKSAPGVKADVVIRTDGANHALRLRASLPRLDSAEQAAPLFRAAVIFFEQTRAITPRVERMVVTLETPSGTTSLIAHKDDVLQLFVEELTVPAFTKKLSRLP